MPILLQIDSSADATTSRTRALTAAVAEAWRERGADYQVVVRDLHADPLPHLRTPAQHWPPVAGRPVVIATARGAAYDPGTRTEGWDHVVPPLQLVLGEGLGMTVHVVATSRTLADRVPDLGAQRAAEEFDAALAEARRLGSTI